MKAILFTAISFTRSGDGLMIGGTKAPIPLVVVFALPVLEIHYVFSFKKTMADIYVQLSAQGQELEL